MLIEGRPLLDAELVIATAGTEELRPVHDAQSTVLRARREAIMLGMPRGTSLALTAERFAGT